MRIAHPTRFLITSLTTRRFTNLSKPFYNSHSLHFQRSHLNPILMATDNLSSSPSAVTAAVDEDAKYGFGRDEMYSTNLSGTVEAYDRHVFLCYKTPESWPSRVESSNEDPLPKLLASSVKARKQDITVKTKVTICGGGEGSDGDVLIFPELIKYKALKESDIDGFVEDVLVNGKPWSSGVQEVLGGTYVFVCAHTNRDMRCGVCGPELIKKLHEEIALRGLGDQVFVSPCSHIGGHKYAGNLIVFSPDSEGKLMGHWYGYVTPDDVPAVLDQHIAKGEIIKRLWRGQMGPPAAKEGETGEGQKVPNGQVADKSIKQLEESNGQVSNVPAFSCCGGANGVTCCSDANPETNGVNEETAEKQGLDKVSVWARQLEQREILTAAAVVGAVATVAIAYSIYRRSG